MGARQAKAEGFHRSFNGFREECLNYNIFLNVAQARSIIEASRLDYNELRPPSLAGADRKRIAWICGKTTRLFAIVVAFEQRRIPSMAIPGCCKYPEPPFLSEMSVLDAYTERQTKPARKCALEFTHRVQR